MSQQRGVTLDPDGKPAEAFMVHCSACGREWSLGWLPMPTASAVAVMKAARCSCGAPRKKLFHGPTPKTTAVGQAEAWLHNGDTGVSSETIWHVLMGRELAHADVPHDPADFGRCYRLLQVMPSWRARLPEVAARYPEWASIVAAWDELTALYEEEVPTHTGTAPKLYDRIDQLRGERA